MTNCSKDMQVNLTIEDAGEGYIKSFKLILVKPSFNTKLKQGLITISGVEMIAEVIILVWTLELGLYSCSEYGHLHVTITPFPAELIKLTLASYNTHPSICANATPSTNANMEGGGWTEPRSHDSK